LIHHRNSEKLFEAFKGENKHLEIFKGNHNTKRPPDVMIKAMEIISLDYYAKSKNQPPVSNSQTSNVDIDSNFREN